MRRKLLHTPAGRKRRARSHSSSEPGVRPRKRRTSSARGSEAGWGTDGDVGSWILSRLMEDSCLARNGMKTDAPRARPGRVAGRGRSEIFGIAAQGAHAWMLAKPRRTGQRGDPHPETLRTGPEVCDNLRLPEESACDARSCPPLSLWGSRSCRPPPAT